MKGRIIVSTLLALLLFVSLPMSALAATWDIGNGDIIVNAGSGGQTVTQGGGAAVEDNAPSLREARRKTPSPSMRRKTRPQTSPSPAQTST